MNDAADKLLAELKLLANGQKRLDYAAVCSAFGKLFPAVTGLEQRRRLQALLNSLRDAGAISLPVGKSHYDRSAEPHMPRWLQLAVERAVPTQRQFDAAAFPWVPELRFAAELRNPQQLDILRRVHEFLASGGAARCMVPIKERSVELFGDEKRLDGLRSGALFRSGRLSLEMLRCFQLSPPLVWERGPSLEQRPILIIENHCTWHSFARWNKDNGRWAAVCYGSGICFETSAPSLGEVVRQSPWDGRFLYFGDLDRAGLDIPLQASRELAKSNLPEVRPEVEPYLLLLELARSIDLPSGPSLEIPPDCISWLGPETKERATEFFSKGVRIPQEILGYEQVLNSFN